MLTDLPAELLQHIAVRIQLAHHIARAAPTCTVVSVAARNAIRARQFSGEVVTLAGHTLGVLCVAALSRRLLPASAVIVQLTAPPSTLQTTCR